MSGKRDRATKRDVRMAAKTATPLPLISNYSNDAGQGSGTFAVDLGLTWRRALLGGVAVGAMWTVATKGALASATCGNGTGTATYDASTHTLTCSGNESPGVIVNSPANLVVKDLDRDIAPTTPGAAGISFHPFGTDANLNSALGTFKIITTTDNADGISASSFGGNVTVFSTGDISVANFAAGIRAAATAGATTVTSNGNITGGTGSSGIVATTTNGFKGAGGSDTVTSTGNITLTGDNDVEGHNAGIFAKGGLPITVTSTGDISTTGNNRDGIYVKSDSSDGCGFDCIVAPAAPTVVTSTGNISTTGNSASAINASVNDGDLNVTSTGDLKTKGDSSPAIRAYSYNGSTTVTSTGKIATEGNGATGIDAGSGYGGVTVTSTGDISTKGDNARGIFARGHREDSGNGEAVVITSKGNISTLGKNSDGIRAENGDGAVTVSSKGNISTGANSSGITVGGGKSRGSNRDVTITSTGDIKLAGGDDTHGRNYGRAGIFARGRAVNITSTGDISTTGRERGGIVAYAYSNPCGSDDSGCAPLQSASAIVTSTGNITTTGNYARGILARNRNGDDVTITSTGNVTVGAETQGISAQTNRGKGQTNLGNVTVTSTGDIKGGANSSGIAAGSDTFYYDGRAGTQDVTVNSTGNITLNDDGQPANLPFNAGRGYSQVAGILANGSGNITITSTGDISTTGDRRDGISAASSPYNFRYYGALIAPVAKPVVIVTSKGNITVTGHLANGISATNGDGDATVSSTGNIAVADFGAGIRASATAGATSVTSKGNISGGASSSGIVAKTYDDRDRGIAGTDTVNSTGNITLTGDNAAEDVSAGIVANGPANVTVTSTGNISTTGDNRSGIHASVAPPLSPDCFECGPAPAVLPAAPANVSVLSKGNITASGANAHDIDASSLGDGSVTVASDGNLKTSGANANAIKARTEKGALAVTTAGGVTTSGDNADGISAQSGDGSVTVASTGNVNTTGKTSDALDAVSNTGKVTVTSKGTVNASGLDSSGIKVTGKSDISVTVGGGSVAGGTGKGASVDFSGGLANTLTNKGTINGGGSGLAVRGTTGDETIENFGTINGNVDLGAAVPASARLAKAIGGTGAFNNHEGGTFNSGASVNVGGGNTLTNDGTVNVGGSTAKATTSVLGRFVQSVKGMFAVDIDHGANTTDKLVVSETATLSGKVLPLLTNIDFNELTRTFKILSAGSTTVNGLSVSDTTTLDYSLLYPNSHDVVLSLAVNFDVKGLTPNQSAVADYFNSGLNGGVSAEMKQVYQILAGAPDAATLGKYLDQLFTSAGGGSVGAALQAGQALAFSLRSCPVADGAYSQLRETSCLWAKPVYRRFEQDKTADTSGITDDTSGISGGFQTAVAENIWGGLGFSVEESNTHIDGISRLDGSWWQIGGALKYVAGQFKVSGSISGGEAELDSTRNLSLPGISSIATGGHNLDFGTGLVRFQYSIGEGGFYATPMFDIAADYLRIGGYAESGAGPLDLVVAGSDKWIVSATPAIEFGANIKTESLTFRPYLKAGVTFLSDDTIETTAYLSGRGPGSQFTVASHFDDVYADINVGVQLFSLQGVNLRFNYDGKFGETSRQHGVDAKVSVDY